MSDLKKIIDDTFTFLQSRIGESVSSAFQSELSATVADLVESPSKQTRPPLEALFTRNQIDATIADKLIKSLIHGITRERRSKYLSNNREVIDFHIPFSKLDRQVVLARARDGIAELRHLSDDKIIQILNNAGLALAQLLGSNVAKSLIFADPAGCMAVRPYIARLVRGGTANLDPIAIGNLFTKLSDEQRLTVVQMISNQLTNAKTNHQQIIDELLRTGKHRQYIVDMLRRNVVPEKFIPGVADLIEQNFDVVDIVDMSDQEITNMISRGLRTITD